MSVYDDRESMLSRLRIARGLTTSHPELRNRELWAKVYKPGLTKLRAWLDTPEAAGQFTDGDTQHIDRLLVTGGRFTLEVFMMHLVGCGSIAIAALILYFAVEAKQGGQAILMALFSVPFAYQGAQYLKWLGK
jgi:hypothetical protein